jgi:hypothetical protein
MAHCIEQQQTRNDYQTCMVSRNQQAATKYNLMCSGLPFDIDIDTSETCKSMFLSLLESFQFKIEKMSTRIFQIIPGKLLENVSQQRATSSSLAAAAYDTTSSPLGFYRNIPSHFIT